MHTMPIMRVHNCLTNLNHILYNGKYIVTARATIKNSLTRTEIIFDNVLLTIQLINYLYGDFLFELYIGSH